MSWSLYRWIWLLESPLHVGTVPAGSLNRCRLYVPAQALWGALVAELARRNAKGFPDYQNVGNNIQQNTRFTYLYPAELYGNEWYAWLPRYERGKGLVWRRENRDDNGGDIHDRILRMRLLITRPATAIDPLSDTAAEGTLRETECINTHWRDENERAASPVALVGYVFLKEKVTIFEEIDLVTIGGDTRYGLGRLRRSGKCKPADHVFGCSVRLDTPDPSIQSDLLLCHGDAPLNANGKMIGQLESLVRWDYGKGCVKDFSSSLWMPGSRWESADSRCAVWRICPSGQLVRL